MIMDILSNLKSRSNMTMLTYQGVGDYIKTYLSEYFGYISDDDIVINLYPIPELSEYGLFVRYRDMISDIPNINSGFLKYNNLLTSQSTYGRIHSMAKNILYQGWRELGAYFTYECRMRFKTNNKMAFDLIYSRIKNNIDISQYMISYKSIIDYINMSLDMPIFNPKSFFRNQTRKMWYTLEDVQLSDLNIDTTKYKIILYYPKTKLSNSILFKKILDTNIIPNSYYYKIQIN